MAPELSLTIRETGKRGRVWGVGGGAGVGGVQAAGSSGVQAYGCKTCHR